VALLSNLFPEGCPSIPHSFVTGKMQRWTLWNSEKTGQTQKTALNSCCRIPLLSRWT
jgi:hypothetical protein